MEETFGSSFFDSKEETKRTERISKHELEEFTMGLSVGGRISFSYLPDVEEFVGEIASKNDFRIRERNERYLITVYREKNICSVSDCHSIADQKFDGNHFCPKHLESYTARHV